MNRRFPIGAESEENGTDFRVWVPESDRVLLYIDKADRYGLRQLNEMTREQSGYFSIYIPQMRAGMRYGFVVGDDSRPLPDPVSRYQPEGPHGFSEVIDRSFAWNDKDWKGIEKHNAVLYEMHAGTFTREGTWEAAGKFLPYLADTGITVIELMPVADFAEGFGWGYDGVNLFAPNRMYGTPVEFKTFIDRAHAIGIGVILDVVYNHVGQEGNYLKIFSPYYFTDRYPNEWGEAVNFDGPLSGPVREYFISNAAYWTVEYHIDGLRFDATQQIFDNSKCHIVKEICDSMRSAAGTKKLFIVAENEPQDVALVKYNGIDSLWNDDFHHSAMVSLTGHSEAYYSDYKGSAQELVSAIKYSFLYQGQIYSWQKKPRGTSTYGMSHHSFIHFLQNHDQIANSCGGMRVHMLSSMAKYRAMTSLLLLGPQLPLLFQGQEFASSSPFYFFAGHTQKFKAPTAEGRRKFLSQFESIANVNGPLVPDPYTEEAFRRSKIDIEEHRKNAGIYALHRDLLSLRREDPVILGEKRKAIDGAVVGRDLFVIRYFGSIDDDDRLLIFNMGSDAVLNPVPEPLMAPSGRHTWKMKWYSEAPVYGGSGVPTVLRENAWWKIAGNCAFLMVPEKDEK